MRPQDGNGDGTAVVDVGAFEHVAESTPPDPVLDAGASADDAAADTFTVRLDGAELVVLLGTTEIFRQAAADTDSLTINGSGDDDTLVLDFSGGTFAFPIDYDGGAGFNTLVMENGSAGTLVHSFTTATSGSVDLGNDGADVTYVNLSPITDNMVVADRVFTFTATTTDGELIQDPADATRTRIRSSVNEQVDFVTPTNSLTINLTGGADTFSVTSLAVGYNTPTNTINAGGGSDEINFETTGAAGANWSVDGDTGNDDLNVSPVAQNLGSLNGTIAFTGGGGSDMIHVNDQNHAAGRTFNIAAASVTFSGTTLQVNFDGTTNDLAVNAGSGADLFNAAPNPDVRLLILGNDPTAAPGDVLNLDLTGVTGAALSPRAPGFVTLTSSNRAQLDAAGIEHVTATGGQLDLVVNANADAAGGTSIGDGAADAFRLVRTNAGTDLELHVNGGLVQT
ncbi:MAG: hypothetical protein ACREIV_09630, partial [Planctomycetaceae bacterium]